MYSVEDLLISHGYKVPQRKSNNVPVSHSTSPHPATYEKCLPTRSDSRCEMDEKRKGHSGVNGYEGEHVYSGGGIRQAPARGFPGDSEKRVRKQRTQDVDNGNSGGGGLPEDTLTTDSGFFEAHKAIHSQPRTEKEMSYWRRRGQDLSMHLAYADFRVPHGNGGVVPNKPEGMHRRPESALSTEEHNRERQRRAESARAREREMALHQWRIAAERKYQSLGTEEWRPMTSMSRQPSESEMAQEQRRPRTAEGAVPPRTKNKSQSLPRMQSESLQYFSIPAAGQNSYGSYKINGHHIRDSHGKHHNDGESRHRWTDRSGAQSAPLSKPRFSRPLRPPSYEAHQQMRGSVEMLAGEPAPRARDRTPLPFSRQEYFVQELGGSGADPPGYNPPPSYRRQPVVKGHRTYPISMGNHQFRGDLYMHGSAMTEVQEWFIRQTGMAWPDHYRDGRRSMPCRRQAYPGYSEERMGNVQYIPFDDPRVRHISETGSNGNSLTDADKIRNIRNEIPVNLESEKNDSALPFTEKPIDHTDPYKSNISEDHVQNDVVKVTECSNLVSDQNRHIVTHGNIVAIQMTTQQFSDSNPGLIETVTQVKKFEAKTVAENAKNSKKKLKETMFCLVSVPISMQANKSVSDPNNNQKVSISIQNTVVPQDDQKLSKNTHKDAPVECRMDQLAESFPLKNENAYSRPMDPSKDTKVLDTRCWSGDQYRNQETQTGSPEASRNTCPPNHHPSQFSNNEGKTNCRVDYAYPMIGQKDLYHSSNSAFSRTGNGNCIKSLISPRSASLPPSPDRQPLLRKTKTLDAQEVFGQFLLKPVNRRKWDAIGELESFNKEIQDHTGKLPKAVKNVEELDEALSSILESSDGRKEQNNSKQETKLLMRSQQLQVTDMQMQSNNLNVKSNSGSKENQEKKVPNSFSERKENLDNQNQTQNCVNLGILQGRDNVPVTHRQDIPVPKECLLKDVGLTVYTAIPDTVTSGSPTCLSPESPMLTSPSDISEMCDTLQITSSDSSGDLSRHSPDLPDGTKRLTNNNNDLNSKGHKAEAGSGCTAVKGSGRLSQIQVIKSLHCRFKANYEVDDEIFYSDHLSWSNEKTLADEHLETLLSQEKANSVQTEDLSNLYQVQSAKGIPENESIEQRAARILGISVPVEALVVDPVDGKALEGNLKTDVPALEKETNLLSLNDSSRHVSKEFEQVLNRSTARCGEVVFREVGVGEDQESAEISACADMQSQRVATKLELPEFPPSNLCLSLPLTEDQELTLSVGGGDRKDTINAETPEASQDSVHAYCSSPLSISPNYQTSLENIDNYANEESCHSSERAITRIPLAKETELEKEVEVLEVGKEEEKLDKKQYCENDIEEDDEIISFMHEENEERTQEEQICTRASPPPKTMARPIPQPRSGTVAKREISLPEGFSMDNSVSAKAEDEKLLISETYDPSRVERV